MTPLCGAFEAQRQYLRQRSAGRHALRKAIQRTDDRGIRMHLATLEEQRATVEALLAELEQSCSRATESCCRRRTEVIQRERARVAELQAP